MNKSELRSLPRQAVAQASVERSVLGNLQSLQRFMERVVQTNIFPPSASPPPVSGLGGLLEQRSHFCKRHSQLQRSPPQPDEEITRKPNSLCVSFSEDWGQETVSVNDVSTALRPPPFVGALGNRVLVCLCVCVFWVITLVKVSER